MDHIWNTVLENISTKISKASFETWLKHTTAEIIDNTIIITAANSFARDWIASHYTQHLSEILTEITGKTYKLIISDINGNEPTQPLSSSSNNESTTNVLTILKEQNVLLKQQQEKIDTLEKRVNDLEKKL